MINIIIILVFSVFTLFASFFVANKRSKKTERVIIKIIGAAFGFIIYIVLNALLNTDFDTSTKLGSYYIFGLLILLFVQRNKFKEQRIN